MSQLVSIIVPCYNAEPWLATTLESALAQNWPDKEIIVVNDGSQDRSLAVAETFHARSIRIVSQPNRGAAAARNRGLQEARGEFIQFLDADDLLAFDKISRQIMTIRPLGAGALASGSWARFQSTPESAVFTHEANQRDFSGVEFLQTNFEQRTMMHPAAWLAPRALLDRAGPWDESLSLNDDGEYFARVALASSQIVHCADARSYYRSNLSGSLSSRKDSRALESLYHSMELTLNGLLKHDASPRSRAAAAFAWKYTAFELYPGAPSLAIKAESACRALGGSDRPFPGSGRFQLAARLLGWRMARRLFA
ncbi:MAG: glycosyltransferase [Lacunisphaera sp.]